VIPVFLLVSECAQFIRSKALAERAAKSAAKVLGEHDPYIREYAKFPEKLESGHAITMPQ
jgi:hypothetical protein